MRVTLVDLSMIEAIRMIAGQLRLNYVVDPEVTAEQAHAPKVTVDWKSVTLRQALTALLESRKLELVPNPETGVARIRKQAAPAGSTPPLESGRVTPP